MLAEPYSFTSPKTLAGKRTLSASEEIRVITKNTDFELLREEWNRLSCRSNSHIFQTFEWNRNWWEFFGEDHELHILTVYSGGDLVGIAPFFKDPIKIFGRSLYSCLRFIGSSVTQPKGPLLLGLNSYSGYLDFIIQPGFERTFYRMIVQYLQQNLTGIDEIVLDEIPEESTIWKSLKPILDENHFSSKIENDSITPLIRLEATWDLYLETMNSKERNKAKRFLKRSEEGKAKKIDIRNVEYDGNLPNVISAFINMHQRQWNERGFAGTFSEKRMRDFSTKIIKQFYRLGWLKIVEAVPVSENGKTLAYDVVLTYNNRVYLLLRGMETDDECRKQSPGFVMIYSHLQEAIQNGAEVFNFLRGGEEYKLKLANRVQQNKKMVIVDDLTEKRSLSNLSVNFMLLVKHAKLEWVQAKYMMSDKTWSAGLKGYVRFITDRLKHKFTRK